MDEGVDVEEVLRQESWRICACWSRWRACWSSSWSSSLAGVVAKARDLSVREAVERFLAAPAAWWAGPGVVCESEPLALAPERTVALAPRRSHRRDGLTLVLLPRLSLYRDEPSKAATGAVAAERGADLGADTEVRRAAREPLAEEDEERDKGVRVTGGESGGDVDVDVVVAWRCRDVEAWWPSSRTGLLPAAVGERRSRGVAGAGDLPRCVDAVEGDLRRRGRGVGSRRDEEDEGTRCRRAVEVGGGGM